MLDLLRNIDFADCLDIAFIALLIYVIIISFKKTRTAFVLIGIVIAGSFYLFARLFNMAMTTSLFQGFFTVALVAVIVIFQEELRYFFERVALWGLKRRLGNRRMIDERPLYPQVDLLVRTLFDLSREKIGALLVVRGRDMLGRHLDGGFELGGRVSEALLKSIFDPHSLGHDGAVVIEKDKVTHFSVHLPLSKNLAEIGTRGTRHTAALGLSERTDALCLVVSEEKGTVSYAVRGQLFPVREPAELAGVLERFYREAHPTAARQPWTRFFQRNYREKALAFGTALILWLVLVHGSEIVYRTYSLPVHIQRIPAEWTVSEVTPSRVKVTFSGPRRDFYLLGRRRLQLKLNLGTWAAGRHRIPIAYNDLSFPESVAPRTIDPPAVQVDVEANNAGGGRNNP